MQYETENTAAYAISNNSIPYCFESLLLSAEFLKTDQTNCGFSKKQ